MTYTGREYIFEFVTNCMVKGGGLRCAYTRHHTCFRVNSSLVDIIAMNLILEFVIVQERSHIIPMRIGSQLNTNAQPHSLDDVVGHIETR